MIVLFCIFVLMCVVVVVLVVCKKLEQQMFLLLEVGVIDVKLQILLLQCELVGCLLLFCSVDVCVCVFGVLFKCVYQEGLQVKQGQILFLIDLVLLCVLFNVFEVQLVLVCVIYVNVKVVVDCVCLLVLQQFVFKFDLDNVELVEWIVLVVVKQVEVVVIFLWINLGYVEVIVLISGVVNKQQVIEGVLVGQGDVILLIIVDQFDLLYVNFLLSVDELIQLCVQQVKGVLVLFGDGKVMVVVKLVDGSIYSELGMLDFFLIMVDLVIGVVLLCVLLLNLQQILLLGVFVSFQVNLGECNNVFLVLQQVLLCDIIGGYVMVVGVDGKVVCKNVKIDGVQNGNWLVSDGFVVGDKVIVVGVQKVKEGVLVVVKLWILGQDVNGKLVVGGVVLVGVVLVVGKVLVDVVKFEQVDVVKLVVIDLNKQ